MSQFCIGNQTESPGWGRDTSKTERTLFVSSNWSERHSGAALQDVGPQGARLWQIFGGPTGLSLPQTPPGLLHRNQCTCFCGICRRSVFSEHDSAICPACTHYFVSTRGSPQRLRTGVNPCFGGSFCGQTLRLCPAGILRQPRS
jgi:hypothetical protein